MKTFVDFAITLLNRDHFSQNQTFVTKAAKFTSDAKSKPTIFPFEILVSKVFFRENCDFIRLVVQGPQSQTRLFNLPILRTKMTIF